MTEPTQTAYDRLSDQQRRFVDAYLETLCAAKAAKTAKYAHPIQAGHRVRHLPEVAAAISEALETRVMGKSEVLERIKRIACNPAATDKDRLRALELLGKAGGIFTEKHEHTFLKKVAGELKEMSDDELRELIAGDGPEAPGAH